jgi:hypothetical protein
MQDLNCPHYYWYHLSFTFHVRCISMVSYIIIIIIIIIILHKISLLYLMTLSLTWIEYAVELHVWLVG